MEPFSLLLQADYNQVSIGLAHGPTLLATSTDSKHNASINLVSRLNELLSAHNITWKDLSYLAINQGPAPFTTLRVIITTANGLNFAHKTPLVGVDGVKTLLNEHITTTSVTVVLLNAFGKDLYFGIKANGTITTGWENYELLLKRLHTDFPATPITFLGNGVALFEKEIKEFFKNNAHIMSPLPEYCSIQALAQTAFAQWTAKENVHGTLLPLYLKTQEYKKAM